MLKYLEVKAIVMDRGDSGRGPGKMEPSWLLESRTHWERCSSVLRSFAALIPLGTVLCAYLLSTYLGR